MSTFSKKDNLLYNSPISETDAKTMVADYLKHPNRIKLTDGQTLKALVVDAEDINTLTSLGAKEFMILFAVSGEDVGRAQSEQNFTTILAAIDQQDKIITSQLRNKFKPCPSACHNYDEVFTSE